MVYAKPIVLHTQTPIAPHIWTDTYCPSLGQTPIVPHTQTDTFWHSFPSAISAWNYSFLCLLLLSCCLHMQYWGMEFMNEPLPAKTPPPPPTLGDFCSNCWAYYGTAKKKKLIQFLCGSWQEWALSELLFFLLHIFLIMYIIFSNVWSFLRIWSVDPVFHHLPWGWASLASSPPYQVVTSKVYQYHAGKLLYHKVQ